MALTEAARSNFAMLRRAFHQGDAALMECQLVASGQPVPVVCAANRDADGTVTFVPFAMFFLDNPYRVVNPPNPEGGFFSQQEPKDG